MILHARASGDMKELMKKDHVAMSKFVFECMEIVDNSRSIDNSENEIERDAGAKSG